MEARFAELLRNYSNKRSLLLKSLLPRIPPGIVSYKNNFLVESLGPIMQHNKTSKLRAIHQSSQFIGAAFMLLGLLFILANKFDYKKTIIPHTVHSILGSLCIIAVIVQAYIGQSKIERLQETHRKIYRWHGDMGLLIWDLVCVTTVVGLASFLPYSFFSVLVLLLPLIACTVVHLQLQLSGYLRDDDTRSNSIDEGESLVIAEGVDSETPPKGEKLFLDTEAIKAENSEDEGDSFSDGSNVA
eukprot:gene26799-32380_t